MNSRIRKTATWLFCLLLLVGVTYSCCFDIFCTGSDGYSEAETLRFPCCTAIEGFSDLNTSDSQHNDQSDCSDCLDAEFGNMQRVQRFQRDDFGNLIKCTLASTIDAISYLTTIGQNNLRLTKFHQLYNQSPPSLSLITTILRC